MREWKSWNKSTKGEHLIKNPLGRDSYGRKQKRGEARSPINPKKGNSGKRKETNADHPSDGPTSEKNTCLLHGPGNSSEECKLLKVFSEKYAAQRPHIETEACYGFKPICCKYF